MPCFSCNQWVETTTGSCGLPWELSSEGQWLFFCDSCRIVDDRRRYWGVPHLLCAIPDWLSNERRLELHGEGVVFGADGSRLKLLDWAYAIPLRQLVQIYYSQGDLEEDSCRYFGRLLCFVCATVDHDYIYCYELFAVARPSCAMKATRATQRLHRALRARRYEANMHSFALTVARHCTRYYLDNASGKAVLAPPHVMVSAKRRA